MEWKDVVGYEGLYKVSEYGDIFSLSSNKLMRPRIAKDGYLRIMLCKNSKHKKLGIHRIVATAFIPNPNSYPIVMHKDNVKLNCHYSNLKWGTYSENIKQAYRDGLNIVTTPSNIGGIEIYNNSSKIIIKGVRNAINEIGCSEYSFYKSLYNNTEIISGPYIGCKIRRHNCIKPISFTRTSPRRKKPSEKPIEFTDSPTIHPIKFNIIS